MFFNNNFGNIVKQNIINVLGAKTKRKIVVFESDDWGSIRMPSKKTYNALLEKGLMVDDPYNRYDSLASEEDLSALFEVLASFKDDFGNHPVFTANCVLCNPDFERIKAHNYEHYFFEPFNTTLTRHSGCEKSFELWLEGMDKGLFHPQFH